MSQTLSFTELCNAIDPKSIGNASESKPLCENIFDVPRSDLFETYNRLRETFWSNEPPPTTTSPTTSSLISTEPITNLIKPTLTTTAITATTNVVAEPVAKTVSPPPLKRQTTDPDILLAQQQLNTNGKRRRLDKTELPNVQIQQQQKELFGSAEILSLYTLWGIKRIMIQQLRCNLPSYDETKMVALIKECDQQCSQEQKHHLKRYIEPILISTRRHCSSLEEALKRW
ncbi:hypothetical protein BDA99DRAFT_528733 [Phascolomyces articulosus]|uniref:Uncharacterized protein n=1 Tax=Phascolomyces articulosus TaxID=60185 RepID=A0AAD5JLF1_9FUNG|nr:hypothetical protein BDA99DRAFT_528733 [Phascolomyces articulosus]